MKGGDRLNYAHYFIEGKAVRIIPLGDIHIGSPQSRIKDVIKIIESADENVRFIFAGDVIDNALRDSVSDIYEQTANPHEALKAFSQLLDLAKGKVLGVISGNHEYRTKKRVGVDILELLCEERRVPYAEDILVLDIAVGGQASYGSRKRLDYLIAIGHGYSSSRTPGGKINANSKIRDVVINCDIYITGHTHQPSVHKEAYFEADRRNKKLLLRERYLLTIPAWLDYESYAARRFYAPSSPGLAMIELSGQKREIIIKLV